MHHTSQKWYFSLRPDNLLVSVIACCTDSKRECKTVYNLMGQPPTTMEQEAYCCGGFKCT
ncbi:hypothetical protein RP20_CCG022578 [Aedes albopictus]|nr:hypothetical protein RP20_CCG022578 [Aedes albopictus]